MSRTSHYITSGHAYNVALSHSWRCWVWSCGPGWGLLDLSVVKVHFPPWDSDHLNHVNILLSSSFLLRASGICWWPLPLQLLWLLWHGWLHSNPGDSVTQEIWKTPLIKSRWGIQEKERSVFWQLEALTKTHSLFPRIGYNAYPEAPYHT